MGLPRMVRYRPGPYPPERRTVELRIDAYACCGWSPASCRYRYATRRGTKHRKLTIASLQCTCPPNPLSAQQERLLSMLSTQTELSLHGVTLRIRFDQYHCAPASGRSAENSNTSTSARVIYMSTLARGAGPHPGLRVECRAQSVCLAFS
jgi:hypothetical protein